MIPQKKIPVILTCAIRASAPRTKLSDVEMRKQATLRSIEKWTKLYPTTNLIVVDGSGTDIGELVDQKHINLNHVHFITTSLEPAAVARRGKGWAEGELVKFALESPPGQLLCGDIFAKCTGKLWCENHDVFTADARGDFAFDYYAKHLTPYRIDTRYYIARTHAYRQRLVNAHYTVDESKGLDLERVFALALSKENPKNYITRIAPVIRGTSGTMAIDYKETFLKSFAKSLRNKMFYYF